jgi:hypothetical protein
MRWLLLVLLIPACAFAEEPRALLARAVAAHGGKERLAEARIERVRLRGSYHLGRVATPFTNDLTFNLPDQFKSVVTMTALGHVVVYVLDGVRASCTINGQPTPIPPDSLAGLRQTLALERAMRLVPLLTDTGVTLTALGEYTVEGTPVVGVGVRRDGQADLKLYFDKKTALLRAAEHQATGPDGKAVVQQARYADHRDLGGYIRPGRVTVYRDGKKAMEAEVVEARRLEAIDPAVFRDP